MDFVTGSASSALDTGQRARLTGVDKGHAHVSASKLFEIRTQIAQGQARRSQLKRLLIAVARVVEEEQGPLALDVRAIELRPRGGQGRFDPIAGRPRDGDNAVEITRTAKQAGQLDGFCLGIAKGAGRVVPQIVAHHDRHSRLLRLREGSPLPQRQNQASA